jgi:UrcA family protein
MSTKTLQSIRAARYVAAFAVAVLSCGAAAAHPDKASDKGMTAKVATTVVNYSDLDLSKESDARSLYVRLQRASRRVCADNWDQRDLKTRILYDACYQESLARAVENVDHAVVTAAFAADESIRLATRPSKAQAKS